MIPTPVMHDFGALLNDQQANGSSRSVLLVTLNILFDSFMVL
jgi:hypothetical protein